MLSELNIIYMFSAQLLLLLLFFNSVWVFLLLHTSHTSSTQSFIAWWVWVLYCLLNSFFYFFLAENCVDIWVTLLYHPTTFTYVLFLYLLLLLLCFTLLCFVSVDIFCQRFFMTFTFLLHYSYMLQYKCLNNYIFN